MSEDLLRRLRLLEDDYPGQPVIAQQADLREINHIRTQLGLPPVDARLTEIGAAVERVEQGPRPGPQDVPDHSAAREIYRAYLEKVRELEIHRAYADRVAAATAGLGQTPVRPLATLGTDGGPLLCDHCGKPIVLEGGPFHGVPADVAWARNPVDDWRSWILGGLVVEIQTNGTLRIYHGYPGARGRKDCCTAASRADKKAREEFGPPRGSKYSDMVLAFLKHEFPDRTSDEQVELLRKILDTMYSYDPGIGINRPPGGGTASDDSSRRARGRKRGRKPKTQP